MLKDEMAPYRVAFDECKMMGFNDADCIPLGDPRDANLELFAGSPFPGPHGTKKEYPPWNANLPPAPRIEDPTKWAREGNRGAFLNPKDLHNPFHPDTGIEVANLRMPLPTDYSSDKVPYRLIPPQTEFYPAIKGRDGIIIGPDGGYDGAPWYL